MYISLMYPADLLGERFLDKSDQKVHLQLPKIICHLDDGRGVSCQPGHRERKEDYYVFAAILSTLQWFR